jgi:hypothetical protein
MSNESKKLELIQEERHYSYGSSQEASVSLRIIQPSKPHGAWSGNNMAIRSWQICPSGQSNYRRCNEKEIRELEQTLGEIEQVELTIHPGLGLVAYDSKE